MHKKYKEQFIILTLALTALLAGCGSVNRESDEAVQGSAIGAALRKKTEEAASQAADIASPGVLQAADIASSEILQATDNYIENHDVEDDDQININTAKYVKLTTEDLVVIEYPYLDIEDEIAYTINEQIYNTILDGVLEDDGWTDRAEVTYEITYVDDKLLSIHFTGYKDKGMYTNGGFYEIGMVFNLGTGDLLCLADVYSPAEIRTLFDTAISEGRIEGWIHYGALPFSQDELDEYINNTFFEMIERENYMNEPGNFFIKEGKLCFLSEPYPSFHSLACLEIEMEEFPMDIEESPYKASEQLPEEITKQIEIYVNEREVWLPKFWKYMEDYYYTWNDLNLDGSLELICSYYEGTGWYSTSYVYAINSTGKVECVAEIGGEDAPDLLWGLELYADVPKEGQAPEHFYIRTGDVTKDARYLYRTDQVINFTAELTEWQRERLRSCTEEYRDATHSELVDTEYRNSEWEDISQKEWEQLEKDFLKGKELITADFAWDRLWTYTYEELAEGALTDKKLGEALEALYISWQELEPGSCRNFYQFFEFLR